MVVSWGWIAIAALALWPLIATPACAQGGGRFVDSDRWSAVFDDPERDAWQKPEAVIRALGIAPHMSVADIGAGTGYFSVRLYVDGDSARLVQCLVNLLTNAAKYTDPGGRIQIVAAEKGGFASIEVSDNGIGMAADFLPRVFDLFVQNDRTLDRSQGGLGIGLCVVRHLVEMHGGTIHARSDGIGLGAKFEIRLPLARPAAAPSAVRLCPKVPPRRILIVDDNADAANSLAALLGLEGHDVHCLFTAREAVERAKALRPEVILLDIGLPEVNGYEVARRLRAEADLAGVRLVAVTGYGQAEDRERGLAAGFDAHLVKPVEVAALNEVLVEALRPACAPM